jgi:hypothetical protein
VKTVKKFGFIKGVEILEKLRDCQLFKREYSLWSELEVVSQREMLLQYINALRGCIQKFPD